MAKVVKVQIGSFRGPPSAVPDAVEVARGYRRAGGRGKQPGLRLGSHELLEVVLDRWPYVGRDGQDTYTGFCLGGTDYGLASVGNDPRLFDTHRVVNRSRWRRSRASTSPRRSWHHGASRRAKRLAVGDGQDGGGDLNDARGRALG